MAYHFRNLVFEGGGVKGIACLGALKVIESKGILSGIVRVGGTSAGAITAVLLALGYTLDEIATIMRDLDFRKLLDDSFGVARDTRRLLRDFGWYKGDYFRRWIGSAIEARTGSSETTFHEMQGRKTAGGFLDLYLVGTNLSTGYAEVFSHEHTPRWCIADAVRISMSIPLFFAARRSPRGDVYVDGGLLDNYPVKLFDRRKYAPEHFAVPDYYALHNRALEASGTSVSPYVFNQETLGFRLDTAKEIAVFRDQAEPPRIPVDDFFDYVACLVGTIMNAQDSGHLHSDDWQRTIYIDTVGVRTTDFDLSDDMKEALAESGRSCAEKYFAWYEDPASRPANRPSST
jgi:NTE family protein